MHTKMQWQHASSQFHAYPVEEEVEILITILFPLLQGMES